MIALTDDYELVQASLLDKDPLPTLEDDIPCLR